jgi:hypothetical protein
MPSGVGDASARPGGHFQFGDPGAGSGGSDIGGGLRPPVVSPPDFEGGPLPVPFDPVTPGDASAGNPVVRGPSADGSLDSGTVGSSHAPSAGGSPNLGGAGLLGGAGGAAAAVGATRLSSASFGAAGLLGGASSASGGGAAVKASAGATAGSGSAARGAGMMGGGMGAGASSEEDNKLRRRGLFAEKLPDDPEENAPVPRGARAGSREARGSD